MIILIEDSDDTRLMIEMLLAGAGFEVKAFASGEPALEYLRKTDGKVDAVVLDLALPTQDGLTIAEEIRFNEQVFEKPPVLMAFYTAYDIKPHGATVRIAEKCHVDHIWKKPDDTARMPELVRDWLQYRKHHPLVVEKELINQCRLRI